MELGCFLFLFILETYKFIYGFYNLFDAKTGKREKSFCFLHMRQCARMIEYVAKHVENSLKSDSEWKFNAAGDTG